METTYQVITWPEIQEYMDKEGFKEHSYLINDEKGMDDFGSSAYMVDTKWKEQTDYQIIDLFGRAGGILSITSVREEVKSAELNKDADFFIANLTKFEEVIQYLIDKLEDYKQKHPQYDKRNELNKKKEHLFIPWVKREDFEFIDGEILLAIKKEYFCLPHIVKVLGNNKIEEVFNESKVYEISDFDYYATITRP